MNTIRQTSLVTLLLAGLCAAVSAAAGPSPDGNVTLRFAVLGDAEPKPCALFPGMKAAVEHVNALAAEGRIDFVAGVGDIAHKGTEIQYENATASTG